VAPLDAFSLAAVGAGLTPFSMFSMKSPSFLAY